MGVEGVVCAHAGAYHPITRNGDKDGMDMVHHPFWLNDLSTASI